MEGMEKPDFSQAARDYVLIEKAVLFLEKESLPNPDASADPAAVAAGLGVPYADFRRAILRWAGTEPEAFFPLLTRDQARRLREGSGDFAASGREDAGPYGEMSLPGEMHLPGLVAVFDGGEAAGDGELRYGFHPSPFGTCMVALSRRGICGLRFLREGVGEAEIIPWLRKLRPEAPVVFDPSATAPQALRVFLPRPHAAPGGGSVPENGDPLRLHLRGTGFQLRVWRALLRIPWGEAVTYGDLARRLGTPRAARAVGGAVGANPIPFLVPCHRVLPGSGGFGNFGEGPPRKKAILAWESLRASAGQGPGR